MNKFLLRWGINTIALYVAVRLLPGLEHTGSGLALLGVALIFGLINAAVKPFVVLLSCPLVLMTFGLYLLVINGLMLLFTAWVSDILELGFEVQGFGWAILGAIVIGLVSFAINSLIVNESQEDEFA
jgi:putative membrane protein